MASPRSVGDQSKGIPPVTLIGENELIGLRSSCRSFSSTS